MNKTICYCYNYTDADIRNDVLKQGGRSLIAERIMAEKAKGACRCTTMHPEGR